VPGNLELRLDGDSLSSASNEARLLNWRRHWETLFLRTPRVWAHESWSRPAATRSPTSPAGNNGIARGCFHF